MLTPIFGDHMHPAGGVDFHKSIRNIDDMHSIEYTGEYAVPKTDLAFKVEDTDHVLTFGVTSGHRERSAMGQHCSSTDHHTHYRPVSIGSVLKKNKHWN